MKLCFDRKKVATVFWKRCGAVLLMSAIGVSLLAGCASKEKAQGASTENTVESEDEVISADELKAAFDSAVPYEGEVQVVLHSSSGEDTILEGPDAKSEAGASLLAMAAKKRSYNRVAAAYASSTLYISGYNYSVWNMLDWDTSTCWAEGNPYSEGTMEGFAYTMARKYRIDGFRIYPGYQKNKKVYRNNIIPLALDVELGGYEFWFNLDDYLMNIKDGETYWIDFYFSTPVTADSMYVMIGAVYTYGNDPDYDCCITEFHPFHY